MAGFSGSGAWAERQAVTTEDLSVVPDEVDLSAAAALPAAGVTALQAVRRLGALLGKRVLITGASGGVGRFAVQLASLSGAEVIAAVGATARGEGLLELGASQLVTALDQVDRPVAAVLEQVGGSVLAEAFELVGPGGLALSIGMASGQPTTIDFERERLRGGDRRLEVFCVSSPFGPDLAELLELVRTSRLDPQIDWRGPWTEATAAAQALLERRLRGKAVLEITGSTGDR